jgi:hypothetical protein
MLNATSTPHLLTPPPNHENNGLAHSRASVLRPVSPARAAEDLAQSRWVLEHRVFPRDPAPGVLDHCGGPVRPAGVPLGALVDMSWHMNFGGF